MLICRAKKRQLTLGAQGHTEFTSHKHELISKQEVAAFGVWFQGPEKEQAFEKHASPQLAATFFFSEYMFPFHRGR